MQRPVIKGSTLASTALTTNTASGANLKAKLY